MWQANENIWVWGGPVKWWGGSMEKDCLIKAVEYFHARNAIYVYGPNNEDMLSYLKPCSRIFCQVKGCAAGYDEVIKDRKEVAQGEEGQLCHPDLEDARIISKLSLSNKAIEGGLVDDFSVHVEKLSTERIKAVQDALRFYNPAMKLAMVVYAENLHKEFGPYLPFLDIINLWVWKYSNLQALPEYIDRARKVFPDKPIMLGLFMHDYGEIEPDSQEMPRDRVEYQFDFAAKALAEGKIDDIVILGDREIAKHPDQAAWIKGFLKEHLSYATEDLCRA